MYLSRLRSIVLSFLLLSVLALTSSAHALDVNGRIKGTVTDPSGAVMPGIQVTATNLATGVKFETKTLGDGNYLFPQLPVGTYSISVSASGFKGFTATGIVINIDQEYVQAVKLEVGNRTETLEVAADAVQVNTTDMQLNNIVDSKQMVELPLLNRTFTGLELIEPGVQAASDRFTGNYSASGSQSQQAEYLVQGADTNDISLNTLTYTPNLDAINQFNLVEGSLNAEYDRNSGGIVSATIKQGTNHFHGDIFEFYRDTFLNTNNYLQKSFNSAGQRTDTIAKYHQNIFGLTIGGPIIKDKLFLFYGYQGTRQIVPEAGGSVSVYTQNNLNGNFSEDLTPQTNHFNYAFSGQVIPGTITALSALNPACVPNGKNTWGVTKDKSGNILTAGCLTSLGGVIPTSAFNTVAYNLVKKYVPLPNNSGVSPYSYIFHPLVTTKANQDLARLDYAISAKNQLTLVGVYNRSSAPETLPFTGATLPGFGDVSTSYTQQYTLDDVHQFSPTLVNEFAAHWTRFNYQAVLPQVPTQPSSAGFQITPQNTAGAGLPTIAVGNFFTLGFSTNGPQPRIDQVYQLGDNVSKVVGQHALKFGYDGRRFNVSNPFSARNNGSYTFSNSNATSPYTTGDSSLDFLLGIPGTYGQGSGATIQAQAYLNYIYGQDAWKVSNTFTLNYGLGYSLDTPLVQKQYQGLAVLCLIGGQQSSVFPNAPKGLNYPGDKSCNSAGGATLYLGELAPRVGFAWAPAGEGAWSKFTGGPGKFSVYAGFGFYYDRTEEESSLETLTTPPFGSTSAGVNDYAPSGAVLTPGFVNPFQDINSGTAYTNKFPYAFPTPGAAINWAKIEPVVKSTYAPGFRAPYAENFQVSIEREFPSQIRARLSYVGSLAHRNQITAEGNYETAAGHAACLAATTACGAFTSSSTQSPIASTNANNQMKNYPTNTAWGSIDPNTGLTGFTSIGEDSSEGSSNYNALQASVTKAYTHGLSFQLSYTYSHALDNGSSFEGSGFGGSNGRGYNQYQPGLNYGNSSYDARQRLVFAPIYTTPILHSSNWYSPMNLALSGWQISGITTVATGFPYDFTVGGSNSLWCSSSNSFYACPDVPVQIGALQTANPRTAPRLNGLPIWYQNTGASFQEEPIGQFGNVGRNRYHGPGINNTNLVVAKNFNLSADGVRRLQLRMESDNVFNHTQFNNPTGALSQTFNPTTGLFTGSPGSISSAQAARQTLLAAKFYF